MPARSPTTTSDPRAEVAEQAKAFARRTDALTAQHADEHPLGLALFDEPLPQMWILNQLYVLGGHAELTAAELSAAVDRHLGDLPHRRATVEDDATGARVAEGMRELGYRAEHLGVMLLGDPPPRPAEGIAREERDDERFREVELAVALDTREQARQIAEVLIGGRARLRASRDGTRTFLGAREGLDVCTVTLYSDGRIAQLEDVATLAAHRGHGIARAALSLATHEALDAGHEHVFLVVDSEEGPVPLYERLGYRLAGYFWTFTRPG